MPIRFEAIANTSSALGNTTVRYPDSSGLYEARSTSAMDLHGCDPEGGGKEELGKKPPRKIGRPGAQKTESLLLMRA